MLAKRAKGSVGEGENAKGLLNDLSSFYSEIQDTQVDVLHQDVSVHQPSVLSDLLGGRTSMDVTSRCRQCGERTKYLHESTVGVP